MKRTTDSTHEPMRRPTRRVLRFAGALVLILVLGGISTLVAIGSIGASDSCGGCDMTPLWASIGMVTSEALAVLWLALMAIAIVRRIMARPPGSHGSAHHSSRISR